MFDTPYDFGSCRTIAAQPVCDDHARDISQALTEFAKNFFAAFLSRLLWTRMCRTLPSWLVWLQSPIGMVSVSGHSEECDKGFAEMLRCLSKATDARSIHATTVCPTILRDVDSVTLITSYANPTNLFLNRGIKRGKVRCTSLKPAILLSSRSSAA